MALSRVKMTKKNGAAIAVANVQADQVAAWENAGWKVEEPPAPKAKK
jgi:hypothetical protein